MAKKPKQPAPAVRLATSGLVGPWGETLRECPPHVRLATALPGEARRTLSQDPGKGLPALLFSYAYLNESNLEVLRDYFYRDWALDSGAFTAHTQGKAVDLEAYIDFCKLAKESDTRLVEVFALDVIGDEKASLRNTERMWEEGIPAIPTYHVGEPESYLLHIAEHYPKIALGGVAARTIKRKLAWAEQCFARVWPKPVHGFAFGTEASILGLPFHSTDASNWELGPCKYGSWKAFAGKRRAQAHVPVRGSHHNLHAEIEYYLRLERRARVKWRKQMEELGDDV